MLNKELWVWTKKKKREREGGAGKIVILSTLSTNHKAGKKKKNDISKQHSKQVIIQGKSRKITQFLLTRFP